MNQSDSSQEWQEIFDFGCRLNLADVSKSRNQTKKIDIKKRRLTCFHTKYNKNKQVEINCNFNN